MAGQGFARWLHAFDAAVASDFRLVGCPVVPTAHKHTLGCDAAHLSHRMFTFHDAVRVSQRRTHTHTHICRRSQRHGTAEGCGRRSSVGLGGLQLFRIRYIIQYATACNTMSVCSMSSRQPLLSTLHTRSNRQLLTRPMVHVSSLEPESSCPPSCLRPFGHRPCPCEQGCRWPDFRACSREHRRPWGLLELAEGVGSCFCVTANRVCVCVCVCVCLCVCVGVCTLT